ncbi:LamG domain-containing protein [Pontibacter kalidii]|uniref:hypothetical protein n=1 Tax=Pontibacter kalidii TaxID=2592049 RepID=UPI002256E4B0|nr:hypothetical protein [Pontibacter kalidii]
MIKRYFFGLPVEIANLSPGSIRVDGVNDRITAIDSQAFQVGATPFSLAVRFLALVLPGASTTARIMSKSGTETGFALFFDRNKLGLFMRPQGSGGSRYNILTAETATLGVETTLGLSRAGTAPTKKEDYKLYLNGVPRTAADLQYTFGTTSNDWPGDMPSGNLDSNASFEFGQSATGGNSFIGYVFIGGQWNRELSNQEHADIHAGVLPAESAVGAWRMDEPQSGMVLEATGSGIDAQMINYTAAELDNGSPYAAWVPEGGLLIYNTTYEVKPFRAQKDLVVKSIYRNRSARTTLNYTHRNASGVEVSSGTVEFVDNTLLFELTMLEGDVLDIGFQASGSNNPFCAIEVHYI